MTDAAPSAWRDHVINSLGRYWNKNSGPVRQLPIPKRELPANPTATAPSMVQMPLPDWAEDLAIAGRLLVPQWAANEAGGRWDQADWLAIAFWYMENLAEREHESSGGSIHSFSFRLKGWDTRIWDRAWVNRIALFLRRWAAHGTRSEEVSLLGPPPKANILLTHDVDAVTKTKAIRFKQAAFNAYNSLLSLRRLRVRQAISNLAKACQFLWRTDEYWCFDQIRKMEDEAGRKSIFNFYAGKPGSQRSPRECLMDPAYDIQDERLRRELAKLCEDGWTIGLHPSYDAWADHQRFRSEKQNLERTIGAEVGTCRQHWLRFSFGQTWQMQEACGIRDDTTLGFNDRSGFRNSTALAWNPWNPARQRTMDIRATPMVLMDSHLYDYNTPSGEDRAKEIGKWVEEVEFVGGEATVIWHQRVFSRDYGWANGYKQLLSLLQTS